MTSGNDWVEQVRRLMEGLRTAAPTAEAGAGDAGAGAGGAGAGGAGAGGGDCRWCPLCQAAAIVRGERPELTAALADILSATATALRQFAGEPAGQSAEAEPAEPAAAEGPAVQRIELA